MIESIHDIPGSSTTIKGGHFKLKITRKTEIEKLQNDKFKKRSAADLYNFLISHTPAGIFQELVKIIIREDIKCNQYYSETLGLDKGEIQIKARKAGLL
jgi:hypothetical protein